MIMQYPTIKINGAILTDCKLSVSPVAIMMPFYLLIIIKKAPELTEALESGMDEDRTRNFRRDRPVL